MSRPRRAIVCLATAVLGGSLMAPAPAASAAPAAPAVVSAPATTTASVARSGQWERQLRSSLNSERKARRWKPLAADGCVDGVARRMARSSAVKRKPTAMSKADVKSLGKCVRAGQRFEVSWVSGNSGRTAKAWVRSNIVKRGQMDRRFTHAGVGAYRDGRGVVWVTILQVRPV